LVCEGADMAMRTALSSTARQALVINNRLYSAWPEQ
jgi:hypothetical protein